ncbi:hypothetical protein DB895_04930 [Flavobacterium psychrotolerans]|uniref:Uncharacterized protein n=1 Tax=Flavobacterium psychrotolerans TaxID=2169410 RepID=A0A2U1JMY2_9FLAO|nr:hypothetical protein DB895_04930 [Flavobacterium psychrotolerans]
MFPLFASIFFFLKKKRKGFPLQSGLNDKYIEINFILIKLTPSCFSLHISLKRNKFVIPKTGNLK